MEYRRLGRAGLRVSVLSYGTWVTFAEQGDLGRAIDCLDLARQAGVNLFDTADAYGSGAAEQVLGIALQELGWDRGSFVVATKLFAGVHTCVNMHQTLNRKYLMQGINESLARLRMSFVDLLYCHRPDPYTPIEETVWAMSDIIARDKAHYWGTSGWSPAQIREACDVAERYRLRKPSMEQSEYNLFARNRMEQDCAKLRRELGLGIITWSPLASGLLTGKYAQGIPAGSRAALPGYAWLQRSLLDGEGNRRVQRLQTIAQSLDASAAQLAIAWCIRHPTVSSVTLGASQPCQLHENLSTLTVLPRLSPETLAELDLLFDVERNGAT